MALKSQITDGTGTHRKAKVSSDHALFVTAIPARAGDLPEGLASASKLYRAYMTNSSGGTGLNVNGSTTAVSFKINAGSDRQISVYQLRVIFNAAQMQIETNEIRRFGPAAAAPGLTNGLIFRTTQSGVVTNIFVEVVKNIGDFLNYSDSYLNLKDSIANGTDLLIFTFDFVEPIALEAQSTDSLEMVVQDDLTTVELFRVIARGTQELV